MRDVTGDFIRSMPLTVVYTLSASLLISLTLTPYLSAKFLKVEQESHGRPFQHLMEKFVDTRYVRLLDGALNHPVRTLIFAGLLFVASLGLFPLVGVSFFPKAEKPFFFIHVQTPAGSTLDRTDEAAQFVERTLKQISGIANVTANVGHGNPRIYYNQRMKRQTNK